MKVIGIDHYPDRLRRRSASSGENISSALIHSGAYRLFVWTYSHVIWRETLACTVLSRLHATTSGNVLPTRFLCAKSGSSIPTPAAPSLPGEVSELGSETQHARHDIRRVHGELELYETGRRSHGRRAGRWGGRRRDGGEMIRFDDTRCIENDSFQAIAIFSSAPRGLAAGTAAVPEESEYATTRRQCHPR